MTKAHRFTRIFYVYFKCQTASKSKNLGGRFNAVINIQGREEMKKKMLGDTQSHIHTHSHTHREKKSQGQKALSV